MSKGAFASLVFLKASGLRFKVRAALDQRGLFAAKGGKPVARFGCGVPGLSRFAAPHGELFHRFILVCSGGLLCLLRFGNKHFGLLGFGARRSEEHTSELQSLM